MDFISLVTGNKFQFNMFIGSELVYKFPFFTGSNISKFYNRTQLELHYGL